MRFDVIFETTNTGWSAYPAEVSGVGIAAANIESARQLIRDAIALHLNIQQTEVDLREFFVKTEQTGNGYVAFLEPFVWGCFVEGATQDDAQDSLAATIEAGCLRAESANRSFYPRLERLEPILTSSPRRILA